LARIVTGKGSSSLFYGDNLEVLRKRIRDETIDLCYIDPPFNSKRNYNQIYNNIGQEDRAQAQAFVDTWVWDERATLGHDEILSNAEGRFQPQLVELIKGLTPVLGRDSLLAYLVSISLRVTEIHRVLKPTGSFYLHCDPTASHYLKIILDAIFVGSGGQYQNEIVWWYSWGGRGRLKWNGKHDTLLYYTKGAEWTFNFQDVLDDHQLVSAGSKSRVKYKGALVHHRINTTSEIPSDKVLPSDTWYIPTINAMAKERMGYPTQKPESLLERIIAASTNQGDTILDCYCGCGSTTVVAERMGRKWVGIDITYQSVSLILRRLEGTFGKSVLDDINIDGIPRDMDSATALSRKKDDRLRKEFEKWCTLTYTNNRAIINEKRGADGGVDGTAYFKTGRSDNAKIIFQVKSGSVKRSDIATLRGDMGREDATLATLITLEEPTSPMRAEAKAAGQYIHEDMGRSYDKIGIVTVREIVEGGKRLEIPMSIEVLAAAKRAANNAQEVLL